MSTPVRTSSTTSQRSPSPAPASKGGKSKVSELKEKKKTKRKNINDNNKKLRPQTWHRHLKALQIEKKIEFHPKFRNALILGLDWQLDTLGRALAARLTHHGRVNINEEDVLAVLHQENLFASDEQHKERERFVGKRVAAYAASFVEPSEEEESGAEDA